MWPGVPESGSYPDAPHHAHEQSKGAPPTQGQRGRGLAVAVPPRDAQGRGLAVPGLQASGNPGFFNDTLTSGTCVHAGKGSGELRHDGHSAAGRGHGRGHGEGTRVPVLCPLNNLQSATANCDLGSHSLGSSSSRNLGSGWTCSETHLLVHRGLHYTSWNP